jgi:hypothetical protein
MLLREMSLLLLWLSGLIGYFAPWVHRQPLTAALGWSAHDLFALLRLLPEIEGATLTVNLQTLQLPLLGLAVLLPLLLMRAPMLVRGGAALAGSGLALLTMPPYPEILTAWRTPGWRVPFWWSVGTLAAICAVVWVLPALTRGDRREHVGWLFMSVAELALIPAAVTFYRLLPALRRLHAAPVGPAWGFWLCIGGLGAIGAVGWYQAARPDRIWARSRVSSGTQQRL